MQSAFRFFTRISHQTPVAFFSMVVGTASLAGAWRSAAQIWHWPHWPGELLALVAIAVWVLLMACQATKWITTADKARQEFGNWVNASLGALAFVASLLVANLLLAWSSSLATGLFLLALVGQLAYSCLYFLPRCLRQGHPFEAVTPALYIPLLATNLTSALVAGKLGWQSLGLMLWGVAVIAWLVLESIILSRWLIGPRPELSQRPLFGVETAPPVVVCLAWLALFPGDASPLVWVCMGWGLLLTLVCLGLLPWWRETGFVPGYWSFSFGAGALAGCAVQLSATLAGASWTRPAQLVMLCATGFILWLWGQTLRQLLSGKLLPGLRPMRPPG